MLKGPITGQICKFPFPISRKIAEANTYTHLLLQAYPLDQVRYACNKYILMRLFGDQYFLSISLARPANRREVRREYIYALKQLRV